MLFNSGLLIFTLIFFLKGAWIPGVILAAYIVLCRMGCMYPVAMRLTDVTLEIEYRKFFKRRIKTVEIANTILVLAVECENGRRSTFIDSSYHLLKVIANGKTEASLDSRDGFIYEKMIIFIQAFADAEAGSGKN